MRSTDDPDDDSQQGPEHTDARPRADSAVARYDVADLEPTTDELEREREREVGSSTEASPQTARYKARSAKRAAFSRKTVRHNL